MRKIILSLLVVLSTVSLYSQKYFSTKTHGLAVYGRGGYNAFFNTLDDTRTLGGGCGEIGLGYELGTLTSGFMLHTGVGVSISNSTMTYKSDITDRRLMYDTEGVEHIAHFTFYDVHERDMYVNINYVLLLGHRWQNGGYFMLGPKIGYALYGNGETTTKVNRRSQYDGLIGDDGDGMLSDMPNHYMDNSVRTYEEGLPKNLYMGLFMECGYSISKRREVNIYENMSQAIYRSIRFAFFCEVGGYVNGSSTNSPFMINQGTNGQYHPTIGNSLYRDQSFITAFSCGMKLTYAIQYKKLICATCDHGFREGR